MRNLILITALILIFNTFGYSQITDLRELSKNHSKVVWVRDFSGKDRHSNSNENKSKIVGFDSKEGKERIIVDKLDGYTKPLFTPDGKRVVFTNRRDKNIYIVNWDGTNLRKLVKGSVADVWQNPVDDMIWVYYQTDFGQKAPLYRMPIDKEGKPELVWNTTELDIDNFQLSRDGKYASGLFPWPKGGVANLETKDWELLGNGCWTSLSPDDSKIFWIFDGSHRNVYISSDNGGKWMVPIGNAPGINGFEVYHPRWSNSPEIISISGPYVGKGGQPGGNRIREGYTKVEIYVGKFSADYKSIEAWMQITKNDVGDYFPDVWVKGGEKIDIPSTISKDINKVNVKTLDSKTINRFKTWPGTNEGLVFLWENSRTENKVKTFDNKNYSAQLKLKGKAIYGINNSLDLSDGLAIIEGANENILHACQNSNQLTIEAYISCDNLVQEGPARIISFSSNASSRNFTLGQDKNKLVMRLRTPFSGNNGSMPQIELGEIKQNEPLHLIVSYAQGHLKCYFNGKQMPLQKTYQGDFSKWSEQQLIFGDEVGGGRNWSGNMEGVAIYNRFFNDEEAAKHYELWQKKIKDRIKPSTIVVNATLEQISTTPEPTSIAPYQRCMAEFVYKINKVEKGTLQTDRIIVTQWVILDGKKIPVSVKIGETKKMFLQKFDDHKELEGERLVSDIDEFDLERFVNINR